MVLKFSAMARHRLSFAARAGALGFGSLPILTPGCTPGGPKLSAGSGRALIAEKTGFGGAPEEAKMVGEPSCEHL